MRNGKYLNQKTNNGKVVGVSRKKGASFYPSAEITGGVLAATEPQKMPARVVWRLLIENPKHKKRREEMSLMGV